MKKQHTERCISQIEKLVVASFAICAFLCGAVQSQALDVTVDPAPGYSGWIGYMNVFNLPAGTYPANPPGAYQFGSGWGTADLIAGFTGPVLKLQPNSIGDPDPFWYTPSGGPGALGNKIMDAVMYVEIGSLPGQTLTFSGTVLSDTLTKANNPSNVDGNGNGWTSIAFIKDFAPDYSSFNIVSVPVAPGPFSISLLTVNDPARHVQYGFETIGPDVWITDNANFGNVQIIPEPSSIVMVAAGLVGLLALRRRS
jgi:hypothetical protein